MVLNKLFKPIFNPFTKEKWQSKNTEVRKKAVQELPVSAQETLADIAANDSDENIRAIAANKLSDLDLLQTIIMKGTNGTVKEAALTRLFQLLSGLKHPIPEFHVREKMIRGSRNYTLLEFVAANANEASLREIAIPRISRDPLLGDIALTDKNSKIRQLAAQQIAKRSTLERVAKQSRRKDKRVYKIVKTKLDKIIEDEERPVRLAAEVVEICDKLEKLKKRNRLLQEKTTFENFVTRWSEIQNFASEKLTKRYHAICEDIITSMDELEHRQQEEQTALVKLNTLLSALSSTVDELLQAGNNGETEARQQEDKHKIITNLGIEWDETLKVLEDKQLIEEYNKKFQTLLDLLDNQTHTEDNSSDTEKLDNLITQAENMLQKDGYIPEKTLAALEDKFQQRIKDSAGTDIEAQQERFNTIITQLKDKLAVQQEKAAQLIKTIEQKNQSIKQLISDGHVSKADKQLHELFKNIDNSEVLSSAEKNRYHQILHDIRATLGDLSAWKNWAHDKERENLIQRAHQVLEQARNSTNLEAEYTEITAEIKELRKQWKNLRSRTQESMWEQFNNTCNEAYSLCTPYIEQQAAQRKTNLKAREQLCEQLETYIDSMGWPIGEDDPVDESIDWIKVDKITRQARKEWSEIGFVERKKHKAINQRFDKDIEVIRNELKKVWHINQQQFNDLIHKVQQLHELMDDDLNTAINKAKQYQQDWKEIGPVSPYQRNKLWKKFRAACDVIFNKRKQQIEQKQSHNTERLREKEAICENLEALNQQPLKRKDLEQAFKDIENLWQELAPEAKAISNEINARYKKAKETFNKKLNDLKAQEQAQEIELLKQKANLCSQLEAIESSDQSAIKDIEQQWQALDALPASLEQAIQNRYQSALDHIKQDHKELIENEQKKKQQFCLKYEILTGHPSPEDQQQARMAIQVELLNSNLGHHSETTENSITPYQLQQQWYVMSNYSQNKALQDRFEALLN